MIHPSGSYSFGDSKSIFCPLGVPYTPSLPVVKSTYMDNPINLAALHLQHSSKCAEKVVPILSNYRTVDMLHILTRVSATFASSAIAQTSLCDLIDLQFTIPLTTMTPDDSLLNC